MRRSLYERRKINLQDVIVSLPAKQIQFLKEQAAKEDLNVTDVLLRSINAEMFFVEQKELGRKILVEEKDQDIKKGR
uniref:Uncharacterized protein n=1 Tax=Candidatus Kentrum sp. UNK TaxID=2126344 RepID=A0A451APR1_9GAMM|nr:MAG: hypothetical protein BECKUNK1418G_GA0071005_11861 [Candidatus Kentron sp. UNK]VFK73152.1 MAG: hypothetical protein BECKUNK1418H_GA0071006_11681 [Candidatus Kentron sp. UNK]